MNPFPLQPRRSRTGFTLVEMMAAIAVLGLLVLLIANLFSSATTVTRLSTVRLDADTQARLVFDRMAADFAWMLRRPDVDFHFLKQNDNAGPPSAPPYSDTFFFFSEVPGYFSSSETSANESNTSLVGYRINSTTFQLERMAWGLTWDLDTYSFPLVYLTYNSTTTYAPLAASTIAASGANWAGIDSSTYNTTDNTATTPGGNFHVLGDSVFRMEYCFLLKDGTYSVVPAINTGAAANNLSANLPPTQTTTGYTVNSRWYDTTNNHAYICTYANANGSTETWRPLGMADVQAIVVTIAILNQTSQKLIPTAKLTTSLQAMATALQGPTWNPTTGRLNNSVPSGQTQTTPPVLMASTWQNEVNQTSFATTAQVPQAVAGQVRIYQRFFYLNNTF
jgi:prepilin-type N-terminal cleavage/methylation domain-containing protein